MNSNSILIIPKQQTDYHSCPFFLGYYFSIHDSLSTAILYNNYSLPLPHPNHLQPSPTLVIII